MQPTTPHATARRLAIRGDGTAAGVVLLVAAPILLLVAVSTPLPTAIGVAGAATCAALGAWLVRWNRVVYRRLLAEVASVYGEHDPGSSPVAWVSDPVWRATNRFDPAVDAAGVLLSEIEPGTASFGADADGAFVKPVLRPVTDAERALVPAGSVDPQAAVPEPGEADALLARLVDTPGRFIAVGVRWPVCCSRLSTLEGVRGRDDVRAGTYLHPGEAPDDWAGDGREGLHAFQCRACARRYDTDPVW